MTCCRCPSHLFNWQPYYWCMKISAPRCLPRLVTTTARRVSISPSLRHPSSRLSFATLLTTLLRNRFDFELGVSAPMKGRDCKMRILLLKGQVIHSSRCSFMPGLWLRGFQETVVLRDTHYHFYIHLPFTSRDTHSIQLVLTSVTISVIKNILRLNCVIVICCLTLRITLGFQSLPPYSPLWSGSHWRTPPVPGSYW